VEAAQDGVQLRPELLELLLGLLDVGVDREPVVAAPHDLEQRPGGEQLAQALAVLPDAVLLARVGGAGDGVALELVDPTGHLRSPSPPAVLPRRETGAMRPDLLDDLPLTVADRSDGRRAGSRGRDRLVMRHGRTSAHRTQPVTRCARVARA
jgi:hypothetical protein